MSGNEQKGESVSEQTSKEVNERELVSVYVSE
jgi:hypothetical protein